MKLFKFPVLVFDNIIILLDPVPLVSLSFCSKKTRERLKKVQFAIKDVWFGNVIEGAYDFFLGVTFPKSSTSLLVDSGSPTRKSKKNLKSFSVQIGDTPFVCRYLMEEHSLIIDCIGYKKSSLFFNYVLELVRAQINEIGIDLKKMDDVKGFLSDPFFQNVQKVTLEGKNAPVKKVTELYDCLKKPVLQTIGYTEIKSLSPTSKLLQSENIFLDPSKFISMEHLLNFSGKYIYLRFSSLLEEDINVFVKHWLDGNYPNLEGAVITLPIDMEFETEKVLDEFNTRRWNPAERAQKFIYKPSFNRVERNEFQKIDCSNGHDLERSDGLLATILFGESGLSFYFFVWHTRFPS